MGVGGVLFLNPPHPSAQTGLRAAEVEGADTYVALSGPRNICSILRTVAGGPSPSCPAVTTCRGIPWAAAARQAGQDADGRIKIVRGLEVPLRRLFY